MEEQVDNKKTFEGLLHSNDLMLMILNLLPIESINAFSLVNKRAHAIMNHQNIATWFKANLPLDYEYFHGENLLGKNDYLLYLACIRRSRKLAYDYFHAEPQSDKILEAISRNDPDALDKALESIEKLTVEAKLLYLSPPGHGELNGMREHYCIYWAYRWKRNKIISYFEKLVNEAYKDTNEFTEAYFNHKIITAKTKEDIQALLNKASMEDLSPEILLAQYDRADLLEIFIDLGCKIEDDECDILRVACFYGSVNMLRALFKNKFYEQSQKNILKNVLNPYWSQWVLPLHPLIAQELLTAVKKSIPKDYKMNLYFLKICTHHPIEIMNEFNTLNLLTERGKKSRLRCAINDGQAILVRHLITLGANPNNTDKNQLTSRLHSRGFSYDTDSNNLNTPLIIATLKNKPRVVQALIECGADIHYRNKNGQKAEDLATDSEIQNIFWQNKVKDLNTQLNALEDKKGDELVSDKALNPIEMRDMIAQTSVNLHEKKLTAWQWFKGLVTHPIKTIRHYKHWKKAKVELKKLKHAWLYEQASSKKEEQVEIIDGGAELKASKSVAKRFTTSYLMHKLDTCHVELKDIDRKKTFKAIEKDIRKTFVGPRGKKDKATSKTEKAHIWRHLQNNQHLSAFANAKADLLEAEAKIYQQPQA